MSRADIKFRPLQARFFIELMAGHRGSALLINVTGNFLPGPGQPVTEEAIAEQQKHPAVL